MDQIVGKLNDKAVQEVRSRLAQEIQVFRFRVCKGNPAFSNLQIASRSQNVLITGFLSNFPDLLAVQAAGEMRYGAAPPNATERSLRGLLDRLGGSGGRDHE